MRRVARAIEGNGIHQGARREAVCFGKALSTFLSIVTSLTPSRIASATNSQPYAVAVAVAHELENAARIDFMLVSREKRLCLRLHLHGLVERERLAAQIAG